MTDLKRRSFFSLFAAPAIVRVASLMPLSLIPAEILAAPPKANTSSFAVEWHLVNGVWVRTARPIVVRGHVEQPEFSSPSMIGQPVSPWAVAKCDKCSRDHPPALKCEMVRSDGVVRLG